MKSNLFSKCQKIVAGLEWGLKLDFLHECQKIDTEKKKKIIVICFKRSLTFKNHGEKKNTFFRLNVWNRIYFSSAKKCNPIKKLSLSKFSAMCMHRFP